MKNEIRIFIISLFILVPSASLANPMTCKDLANKLRKENFGGYQEKLFELQNAGVPQKFITKTKKERDDAIMKHIRDNPSLCTQNADPHSQKESKTESDSKPEPKHEPRPENESNPEN